MFDFSPPCSCYPMPLNVLSWTVVICVVLGISGSLRMPCLWWSIP